MKWYTSGGGARDEFWLFWCYSFVSRRGNANTEEDNLSHLYHIPWKERLLLIMSILLQNHSKAIKKSQLTNRFFVKKSRKTIYGYFHSNCSVSNLNLLFFYESYKDVTTCLSFPTILRPWTKEKGVSTKERGRVGQVNDIHRLSSHLMKGTSWPQEKRGTS